MPGHTHLVPDKPRNNTPRISNGEIWDIEVVAAAEPGLHRRQLHLDRQHDRPDDDDQPGLPGVSYNLNTGLIDTQFRPTFDGGGVPRSRPRPDGTKLFVGGSFNTVNGVAKQKVASLNLTTGAPLTTFGFTNSTNNQVTVAGRHQLHAVRRWPVHPDQRRAQDRPRRGERRVGRGRHEPSTTTSSGGIGVNGQLGVPQLKLTHDNSKLLVVHTGRQIDGQDRLRHGHHRHRDQAAAALAQHAVGH